MGKNIIISLIWYGFAFIVNQKLKSKIYKLGKGDDKIPVPRLARSRSQKQNENETEI